MIRSVLRASLVAAALFGTVVPAPAPGAPACDYVFAVTSDYSVSGTCSTVEVLPPWPADVGVAGVHSDAVAREYCGLIYVVNRLYGDNIQVIDPSDDFATVRQFSVGPGSDPHDIAFVSHDRAYVTRYESRWLLEVNPATGAVTDSVDLGPLADADGVPEMDGAVVAGGLLFVAVERLDRDYYWTPVPPSYLAVVDIETNALVDCDPLAPGVQGVELGCTNPRGEILPGEDGATLYVACPGSWGALDGGIEAVDTGSLESVGAVASEQGLGGELQDFTLPIGGRGFAVVTDAAWVTSCVAFDWATGAVVETLLVTGGYDLADIELHEGTGQLFVSDRTYAAPGVRIFDGPGGGELTVSPIAVGLPPHDLLLVGEAVTGVPWDPAETAGATALGVLPNPCRGRAVIVCAPKSRGAVALDIFDVSGRRVRSLRAVAGEDGVARAEWDGRDSGGARVASGVYLVKLGGEDASQLARVVLLR